MDGTRVRADGMRGPAAPVESLRIQTVNADSYRQAKQRLREAIAQLGDRGVLRLPSEAELSTALGVSRATLRSALQALQQEGRIRRLHGHGTFINRRALGIGANLSQASAFVDLLTDAGYRADVRVVEQGVVPLTPELAEPLELAEGAPALRIERLFDADGVPAVHSVDHFPTNLWDDRPAPHDAGRSTFEFVERHAGQPICYSVARVRPVLPPPEVARLLRIEPTHPLLRLHHVHILANEKPVAVTVAHVNDEYVGFSVVRSHLDN
jgi:GntR family transcriptional regulator